MKILMLNYEFPPIGGGAGKANLLLLDELAGRKDIKIDVLVSSPYPGYTVEHFADNIVIHKVGVHKKNLHFWTRLEVLQWLFKAWFAYRKLLKKNQYDFVHAFFGFPTAVLCYLTRKKMPYMISLRGSDVPGINARMAFEYKVLGPLFKKIWKNASRIVACSEGLKQRALRFEPSVNIEVISNGVNSKEFYPIDGKKISGTANLIAVGRLSMTKRVELLIDAVQLLLQKGHDVKLTIVGGGALESQLRSLITQKKLNSNIAIIGRVDSELMPEFYRKNDLFVSASAQEGMSNAMLEAMASGLPIVTTKCEGVEELIQENGVVTEGNPVAIGDAIVKVIDEELTYSAMAQASRNHALQFDWPGVADKYIVIYDAIMA